MDLDKYKKLEGEGGQGYIKTVRDDDEVRIHQNDNEDSIDTHLLLQLSENRMQVSP